MDFRLKSLCIIFFDAPCTRPQNFANTSGIILWYGILDCDIDDLYSFHCASKPTVRVFCVTGSKQEIGAFSDFPTKSQTVDYVSPGLSPIPWGPFHNYLLQNWSSVLPHFWHDSRYNMKLLTRACLRKLFCICLVLFEGWEDIWCFIVFWESVVRLFYVSLCFGSVVRLWLSCKLP